MTESLLLAADQAMSWPEAFATVGACFAFVAVLWVLTR